MKALMARSSARMCRVSQYFNGADPRTRIKEMASLATAVDHVQLTVR